MNKYFRMAFLLFAVILSACQPVAPTSSPEQNNTVENVHVIVTEPTESLIDTEDFPLPNCGGTSELRQTLGTQASVTKSVTIGGKATLKGGAEADIPELAKLELAIEVEGTYQKTYESANSRLDTIGMQAEKGTHVVYVIGWYEQTYSSMIEYSSNGQVYEAPYTYKLRIPKIESSNNIACTYTQSADSNFTGTWEGVDPSDNSITTITFTQTGNVLSGTYNDSYSGNNNPPGWHGNGSGTIFSPTTAHIIFDVSRWDNKTGVFDVQLLFSSENNTITVNNCIWQNEIDTAGCPMVLQRK